jgi:hypothetical protein
VKQTLLHPLTVLMFALYAMLSAIAGIIPATAAEASGILRSVNGQAITAGQLRLEQRLRELPETLSEQQHSYLLEQLTSRALIQQFLKTEKLELDTDRIRDRQVRIEQRLTDSQHNMEAIHKACGSVPADLTTTVEVSLGWQVYVRNKTTEEDLARYFETHRLELDGTRWRASQILLKRTWDVAEGAKSNAAQKGLARLQETRQSLMNEITRFGETARKISEAASAAEGGDVGWFAYSGRMPTSFTRPLLGLKPGELAEPFLSEFGAHLVLVTDLEPGNLSLEDVRVEIFRELENSLWIETASKLRKSAVIK